MGKLVLALRERPGRGRRELPEGPRAKYPHGATCVEGGFELGLGAALSLLVRSPLVLEQQLPLRPPFGLGDSPSFPWIFVVFFMKSWRRRKEGLRKRRRQTMEDLLALVTVIFDIMCRTFFSLRPKTSMNRNK